MFSDSNIKSVSLIFVWAKNYLIDEYIILRWTGLCPDCDISDTDSYNDIDSDSDNDSVSLIWFFYGCKWPDGERDILVIVIVIVTVKDLHVLSPLI